MAKKRREKPKRELTKRQLSRWEQQKKRQRIIFGLGLLVVVAVVAVIGIAWYFNDYQPRHETMLTVNDTEFDMDYYLKMLKIYGTNMADQIVEVIKQNELIRQEAEKLGITVSNDEVTEKLKSNDPPLSNDYRDLVRAGLVVNKLRDEYFEKEVPMSATQRHITAMFLESEKQAVEVRNRLEQGEDFAQLAGELSLDSLSRQNKGDLGWYPKDVLPMKVGSSILEERAFDSETGVLSEPINDGEKYKSLGYWIVKVLEINEESKEVHVQAILLGSEDEAGKINERLDNGEDFAALAEELSQDAASKANGGDMDWLIEDENMSPAFNNFVFNPETELNTLSEPIRDDTVATAGGSWLMRVEAVEDDRQIEEEDRDLLISKALNEWIKAIQADSENVVDDSYLDEEKKEWAILKVAGSGS